MSQQTNFEIQQVTESRQVSEYIRPPNKMASYISQASVNQEEFLKVQVTRSPFSQKHKTFAAIDPSKKTYEPKYRLNTVAQRKVLLLLSFIEKFVKDYEQKQVTEERQSQKLHADRKKAFNLSNCSDFQVIEPISLQHMNQQQAYIFFIKMRDSVKLLFRQNFVTQLKKRRSKIMRGFSKEQKLESIQQTQKENNRQLTQQQNMGPTTFITCDINSMSMSQTLPNVDLMTVSNFPNNIGEMLQDVNIKAKQKFHAIKLNHSKSRLRIHPAKNKYQSRKKEEIRLFLQLNEKTEHLQNFRSDEGKFFKFNQNLKITIKNINLCRIVLLNKKNAVMEQFQRLGDDSYFKELNEKLVSGSKKDLLNKGQSENESKKLQKETQSLDYSQQFNKTFTSSFESATSYKQKALRIKNYFQQTSKYFNQIQTFLLQFMKKDKGYQNYLKENTLKLKLKLYQKHSYTQKFYSEFVDRCFHMSQITRLYFNALNQMTHQNINLKELKLLNKDQLEKENKILIELRYVLIYLQKQCQNTNESTFFRRTQGTGFFNTMNKTNNFTPIMSQQPSSRSNISNTKQNFMSQITKQTQQNNNPLFKQKQNTLQLPKTSQPQLSKKSSQLTLNGGSMSKLAPVINPIEAQLTKNKIPRLSKHQQRVSSNSVKQEQIDINEIWKTFYNKKFSSNAMRIRLY